MIVDGAMKRVTGVKTAFLGLSLILALAGWMAYRSRVRIEAWWWHRQHGETLVFAEYRVPAPVDWYVLDSGRESAALVRLDTDDHTRGPASGSRLRFPATVSLYTSNAASNRDRLDLLTRLEGAELEKKGLQPVFRKFDFDGESLSCVGGQRFSQATTGPEFYQTDPNVWRCQTSGRLILRLTAVDADMPKVWEIVSHIRKKT